MVGDLIGGCRGVWGIVPNILLICVFIFPRYPSSAFLSVFSPTHSSSEHVQVFLTHPSLQGIVPIAPLRTYSSA